MTSLSPVQQQVLHVAMPLFFRFGYNRVTTEEIAKEAGISKKTLYEVFPSKLDIVIQLFKVAGRSINTYLAETPQPTAETFAVYLKDLLRVTARANATFSRPMIKDIAQTDRRLMNRIDQFRRTFLRRRLLEVLQKGRSLGVLNPDIQLEVTVTAIGCVMDHLIHPDASDRPLDDRELDQTLELLMFGVQRREERENVI
jgi:AcrR family transcriptional regulator